jgi:hypothetical protein
VAETRDATQIAGTGRLSYFAHCLVADVDALDEEDYVFDDVGGMVSYAFQTSGDDQVIDGSGDGGGVALHQGQKLLLDCVAGRVHRIIRGEHAMGDFDVALYKSVEVDLPPGLRQTVKRLVTVRW